MDGMRVLAEVLPGQDFSESKEACSKMLAQKIKDHVGVSVDVMVSEPGSVERSQGKARRVVDNRPKDS